MPRLEFSLGSITLVLDAPPCEVLRGSRVLVELPEGLRGILDQLLEYILACGARDVAVRLEPSYGGCDVGVEHASTIGANIVLHVGHLPYPHEAVHSSSLRIVYAPIEYVTSEELDSLAERLECRECLACIPYYRGLCTSLSRLFKRVLTVELLGCITPRSSDCRCILVVGSRFHALGVALANHCETSVMVYDPLSRRLESIDSEARRVLAAMYHRSLVAREREKWGIIVGVKPGQYRPRIVQRIRESALRAGKRVVLLTSSRLLRQDLDSIPESIAEVFVVTSCPRLAIEDLLDYWRPVLTPGEALYALGVYDKVVFPW